MHEETCIKYRLVSSLLSKRRRDKKLSQTAQFLVLKRSGVAIRTKGQLSYWESGERLPPPSQLSLIAETYGVDLQELKLAYVADKTVHAVKTAMVDVGLPIANMTP